MSRLFNNNYRKSSTKSYWICDYRVEDDKPSRVELHSIFRTDILDTIRNKQIIGYCC